MLSDKQIRRLESQRSQGLVEFALVAVPLLLMLFGILDFGLGFADNIALADGTRAAARYGAVYPSNLSNASPATSSSIQGQLQQTAGITGIKNQDSNITIIYLVPSGGSATQCGQYSQATNTITYAAGYTQSNCLLQGNLIKVSVNWTYTLLTPMLASMYSGGIQLKQSSVMMLEQPQP